MSYDLRFVPRDGAANVTGAEIGKFLKETQPNVTLTKRQAEYANETTGVYFLFDLEDDPNEPLVAAINLLRPSIFALEAAEVIATLSERFALDVIDDQAETHGAFDSSAFLAAWTQTNEGALRGDRTIGKWSLPRNELVSQWHWNRHVGRTGQIVAWTFAAKVMYRVIDDVARSFAVVVENNPTVVPVVDEVKLLREKPGKLFGKTKFTATVVPFSSVQPFAVKGIERVDGLPYVLLDEMKGLFEREFVENNEQSNHGSVSIDRIMDRESVSFATSKG